MSSQLLTVITDAKLTLSATQQNSNSLSQNFYVCIQQIKWKSSALNFVINEFQCCLVTINRERTDMEVLRQNGRGVSDTARWLLGCQSQRSCTQFCTSAEPNTSPLCREQAAGMAGPVDRTWTECFSDRTESGSDHRIPTSDLCNIITSTRHHVINSVTAAVRVGFMRVQTVWPNRTHKCMGPQRFNNILQDTHRRVLLNSGK